MIVRLTVMASCPVHITNLLFFRLGGYPPFSDEITEYSLHDQICQARYSFLDCYWSGVSDNGKNLIKRLLTLDPKKRISSTEALEHPWMQDEEVVGKARKIMEAAATWKCGHATSTTDTYKNYSVSVVSIIRSTVSEMYQFLKIRSTLVNFGCQKPSILSLSLSFPSKFHKRSAPSDEEDTPNKPIKHPPIEASSPSSEAPPTSSIPTDVALMVTPLALK